MNPMLKVSAAVLIAAMSILPATGAFAAADAANVVMGTKTDIVPIANLDGLIGKWSKADLASLDSAKSVTVFDTKTLYPTADQKMISTAEAGQSSDLTKLHTAINADAGLKAWFATNKIDVNRVVGFSVTNGAADLYLY